MIMTIPGNFKKISFQWVEFPTTSSIMMIHFCFILQKGREKNYIVSFFILAKTIQISSEAAQSEMDKKKSSLGLFLTRVKIFLLKRKKYDIQTLV